jgi:hypothetical protein
MGAVGAYASGSTVADSAARGARVLSESGIASCGGYGRRWVSSASWWAGAAPAAVGVARRWALSYPFFLLYRTSICWVFVRIQLDFVPSCRGGSTDRTRTPPACSTERSALATTTIEEERRCNVLDLVQAITAWIDFLLNLFGAKSILAASRCSILVFVALIINAN